MHLGKSFPKLSLSCSTRRIRLGVGHHGAPSAWTAPVKDRDVAPERDKSRKQKRR